MGKHLDRELECLKKILIELGTAVEENVHRSIKAYQNRDTVLAQDVIDTDKLIDRMEIRIEEECLKALALYQPVAAELRFIISILKINNDLERIGDLSANIARNVLFLAKEKDNLGVDLMPMMTNVKGMLKDSLDAFTNQNPGLAKSVCARDTTVDLQKNSTKDMIKALLQQDSTHIEGLLKLVSMAHQLERIADHATNIAEDVVYLVDGDIMRHNRLLESSKV